MEAACVRSLLLTSSTSPRHAASPDSRSSACVRRKKRSPRTGLARRGAGGPLRPLILDVVLLHLAVQRRPIQPQDLSGFLLVPVRTLERLYDRHLLDFSQ